MVVGGGGDDRMTGPDDLIRALSEDLTPVRPIPRLRTMGVVVVAFWLLVSLIGAFVLGVRSDYADVLLMDKGLLAVFLALGVAGLGGVIAALAAAVPGREAATRAGFFVGAGGLGVAAAVTSLLIANRPETVASAPFAAHLTCLIMACVAALLPSAAALWFAGRAAAMRPVFIVIAAAAGSAALSTIASMTHCTYDDPVHLFLGHVLAPVAGAMLLVTPLLFALRKFSREA